MRERGAAFWMCIAGALTCCALTTAVVFMICDCGVPFPLVFCLPVFSLAAVVFAVMAFMKIDGQDLF